MQVPNPQYKFYRKLEGTWKSVDSSCTAVLDVYAHLVITYGNFKLDSSYSCMETGLLYEAQMMNGPANTLGLACMFYKRHDGEELKIQINKPALSDGPNTSYIVSCLWYGEEKLNIELKDLFSGQITALVLTREPADAAPASGYVCECGYTGPFGKFCPNCGKAVEEEYTCQCGYRSKGTKFCPNCGLPTGQSTAPVSAPAAPAAPATLEPADPVPLFSISTYMSTNPPVQTFTKVYEYSDTQLLLDNNGKRRLIPAEVKEQAMEIIRKNKLDDPDFTDPSAMGIMGGSVSIGFKDGGKIVQTSLQKQGFAVTNAQNELMGLFDKA